MSVGHPVQVERNEVLSGDDRDDAGDLEGLRRVDVLDSRVRERAARDVQVQHAGQLHVVDVLALPADEARVFLLRLTLWPIPPMSTATSGLPFRRSRHDARRVVDWDFTMFT